ncbi:MAG: uridine kinase, partial [Gemmataceae bacterium]
VAMNLGPVVERICAVRQETAPSRCVLAALTGIDGSGKGYVAARLVEALQAGGLRAAAHNIDGWLNLPGERFDPANPAEHFYHHALRFDDMFRELVLPVRDQRSRRVEADFAEETATAFRRHVYEYTDVDVLVLEGIYLLKRAFVRHYDLSVWIDCTFETALERAIARGQEGLAAEETVRAYRTIYFPAQEIHFERDQPRETANLILNNDSSQPTKSSKVTAAAIRRS